MNHRDAILGILASARGAGHTAALLDAVLEPPARRTDGVRARIGGGVEGRRLLLVPPATHLGLLALVLENPACINAEFV